MKAASEFLPAEVKPVLTLDENHIYRLGARVVPGVTDILRDAGMVSADWYTEFARERGNAVHMATRFYDEGDLDEETVDARVRGYLDAWKLFREELWFEPERIEESLYHPVHLFAGTIDRTGRLKNGHYVLIDIKTGQGCDSHPLQLAAYQSMLGDDCARYHRVVVRLKPTGKYSVTEFPLQEYGRDFGVFIACLTITNYKRGRK